MKIANNRVKKISKATANVEQLGNQAYANKNKQRFVAVIKPLRIVLAYLHNQLFKLKINATQSMLFGVMSALLLLCINYSIFGVAVTNTIENLMLIFVVAILVTLLMLEFLIDFKAKAISTWGRFSESETASCLNRVKAGGARVLHDVPINSDGGPIQHVVVCEQGVFAVETKAWRKVERNNSFVSYDGQSLKFPSNYTDQPINDALYNARTLNQFIFDTTGEHIEVKPVVSVPGWTVLPVVQHPAHRNCAALNPKNFHYLLAEKKLSTQQVEKIHRELTRACNDDPFAVETSVVAPTGDWFTHFFRHIS